MVKRFVNSGKARPCSDTALKPAITRTMLLFFIVGDILGGGIYALVGEVGDKVGGAFWTGVRGRRRGRRLHRRLLRASSSPSTRRPAARRCSCTARSSVPLLTFLIAFAVMCSGVASAATLATAFGGDYLSEFVDLPTVLVGLVVIARAVADQLPRDQGVGLLQHGLHG